MRASTPISQRDCEPIIPTTAKIFEEMEAEEDEHRGKLIQEYRRRWRTHSFDSSRRRKGVRAPQTGVDVETQEEKAHRRLFVLQIVQPGLAGLMDGSVSTLAPVFAAAFSTHSSHAAFVVSLAASVGAGISMAFAEAASDDGSLTGRGKPLLRGFVCGLMTTAGGIGHTYHI